MMVCGGASKKGLDSLLQSLFKEQFGQIQWIEFILWLFIPQAGGNNTEGSATNSLNAEMSGKGLKSSLISPILKQRAHGDIAKKLPTITHQHLWSSFLLCWLCVEQKRVGIKITSGMIRRKLRWWQRDGNHTMNCMIILRYKAQAQVTLLRSHPHKHLISISSHPVAVCVVWYVYR